MDASRDPSPTVDELPLLGEVFAIELANSHYRGDHDDLDFLADADAVATWFAHAPAAAGVTVPRPLPTDAVAALRRVRDATRLLLGQAADDRRSPAAAGAAEVLHSASRRAAGHLALDVGHDGAPAWHLHHDGSDTDVLVAATASRCILFLGGDDVGRVRRCARAGCPMFFVQRHRARRFCHDSCAHTTRQARYYRSMVRPRRARPADPASGP
ncbi:ABATE domain-containing protein [Pseudonocardia aurantiaca]|uniref:ABATE domain-containing protein n=1 Tax=Pseudonocardia aurantiaca TaxID=75290 RepID=A0ABW4FIL1_9PSEU